jgi:outer membrane lipoprotein SlyB
MTRSLSRFLAAAAAAAMLGITAAVPAQVTPAAPAPAKPCATCGVVESIRYVEQAGQSSGVGAVAGGVLGGVLGHQIGSGRGNTVATVAGAAGGAYVGNQVEKNKNRKAYYGVTVRLDNGKRQTLSMASAPAVKEGERVKIVDGNRLALLQN